MSAKINFTSSEQRFCTKLFIPLLETPVFVSLCSKNQILFVCFCVNYKKVRFDFSVELLTYFTIGEFIYNQV